MKKNELREMAFAEEKVYPKIQIINAIWTLLFFTFNIATIIVVLVSTKDMDPYDKVDPLIMITSFIGDILNELHLSSLIYLFYIILFLFLYLALKLIMTVLFARDKSDNQNIKLKFIEGYSKMPICSCKEALKVWQTVLIYFVPFTLMFSGLFYITYKYAGYVPILFFMLFPMTLDLLPVICIPYYKIRYGIDYISLDRHIYEMTLFSNTSYIKDTKKSKKILKINKL